MLVPGGGSDLIATTNEAGQDDLRGSWAPTTVTDEGGESPTTAARWNLAFQYGQPTRREVPLRIRRGDVDDDQRQRDGGLLKDGFYYNLAVAAVDGVGNVGPLSNVLCGEPVPVADFWRLYYEAGGRAGGGFCAAAAEGVGVPAGTSGLGVLMAASIVAIIRKRRRS